MSDAQLFAFENDFVASLRCIPMAVRMKLDRCAIKLSLRQWSRFGREDRQHLLERPCRSPAQVDAYRAGLVELVNLRTGEKATPLEVPPLALRESATEVPLVVTTYARSIDVAPPTLADWCTLDELQRYVLIKLTRDSHDNINFIPAMQEFGLLGERG